MDVTSGCVSVLRSNENTIPAELELNRIINNIQELLYSASDISHDRCVKVLTARAKVGLSPLGSRQLIKVDCLAHGHKNKLTSYQQNTQIYRLN